ncbi:MAG: imelysin family protein [Acidimicrobiales bacterium]
MRRRPADGAGGDPAPRRAWWRASRAVWAGAVIALAASVGAALFVGLAPSAHANGGSAPGTVDVSDRACAPGWTAPHSGQVTFNVDNTSKNGIFGVDLVGANQTSVYGEIEMIAPGTEVPMNVVLPPGRYSFECESFTGATLYSLPEEVTGPKVSGAHPYIPVESDQVQQAIVTYQSSLRPYLALLETDTDALTQAVDRGNLTAAQALWLPAHLDYARLGAAYDTFGNFNDEIDGRPLGLVGGVNSPDFHGFLRLEYGLWHGQPASELIPVANALDAAVHGLVTQFPSMLMPINDLSLRTHEILENTLQFELTGETDEGSNTNLATAWANAQGTQLALAAITPLLRISDPSLLASVTTGLAALTAAFKSYQQPDGTWTPLQSLTTSQREDLDGSLSALLEQLSAIPDLLDLPIRPENPND